MSDVLLFGVLRMPYEMAMSNELSRFQFWQRAQEAADRLEAAERTPAEPAPASTGLSLIEYRASADDVWHSAPLSELKSLVKDGFQVRAAPVAARELDVEAERREFEAFMLSEEGPFGARPNPNWVRCIDGKYVQTEVAMRWWGWLDRAARSAAQGTAPAPADESLTSDEIEALRAALSWMGESTYETLEECGIYQRSLLRRLIHAVVASRDATFVAQSTRPESAPVSTEQAGDAWKPKQNRYMDEIDAGAAGERWLEQFIPGSVKMLRSEEPSGGQSVRVKWVVLFDRNDVLTYGYILTRDIMNWTQITFIKGAPSPNNSPVGADRRE